MSKKSKVDKDTPTLSFTRAKWVGNGIYQSKYLQKGKLCRDGCSFMQHKKCGRCGKRLTKKEYDQLGYLCYDCI